MAFEEWYQEHADSVYSYLLYKLNDVFLAEDLLQETFLAAYIQSRGPNPTGNVRSWLLSIAHHKMVDRLRKARRSPKESAYLAPEDVDSKYQPDHSCKRLMLQEMLAQISPTAKDVVYLVYVEGYTFEEAARILKIPEGTAKSTCHYAKKKLRDWLGQGDVGRESFK